jgi:hypothetical protein
MAGIGQEYTLQDVTIRLRNRNITGAQSISYTSAQDSANVYGTGREPRAYSKGKRTYEGEITVTGGQLNELIAAIGTGRTKNLLALPPFDVSVTYGSDESLSVWTDALRDCRFTEIPKELGLDDEFMEVTLPLAIGRIDYGTVIV